MHGSGNDSVQLLQLSPSPPSLSLSRSLGWLLQTQRDPFNAVSAVRHQPHHQDARRLLSGDPPLDAAVHTEQRGSGSSRMRRRDEAEERTVRSPLRPLCEKYLRLRD